MGLSLALVGCSPQEPDFSAGQPVPPEFPDAEAYARQVFALTNELRAERGLSELEWAQCAVDIASSRLTLIVASQEFAHPDSSTTCADATASGENLAHGIFLPAQLLGEWEASAGHFSNLVNPDYRRTGVACILTGIDEPLEPAGGQDVGGILCSQVFED